MSSWEDSRLEEQKTLRIKAEADMVRAQHEAKGELDPLAQEKQRTERTLGLFTACARVAGPALLIHMTWAITVICVTWILVVNGWRFQP